MSKTKKKPTTKNISKKILKIFRKNPDKKFNHKQIAAKLTLDKPNERDLVVKELSKLAGKEKLKQVARGKFQYDEQSEFFDGVLDMTARGDGYVIVDELPNDVFVFRKNINRAFNKDRVRINIFFNRKKKKEEGEVVDILERKKTHFVGKFRRNKNFGFVEVQDQKVYTDLFIPKANINKAEDGQIVVAEMTKWLEKDDSPTGKVTEILGQPGEHETEMQTILRENSLPSDFPKEVEDFANQIDTKIHKSELGKRRDMRDVLTFTIDPKSAKDFDDGLSFRKLDNGNHEIGIHIADVSHYVKPGTILDDEAFERATSIYLVDRVVPMLPEVLSNGVCSLGPQEEKYTFSAVFELDKNGYVQNEWFGRTVTYSDARFAYEEAQHFIETKSADIPAEISHTDEAYSTSSEVVEAVNKLNDLAKIMRGRRMSAGAISFDKVEVEFDLDKDNEPVGVFFKTQKDANKLIEEFMLLANRKVAEFIGKKKNDEKAKTFIYRCHDEPDSEKLHDLKDLVSQFGHNLRLDDKNKISSSLNKLMKDVDGKKEQNLVDTLAIRTMSKAYYSTKNIGHYGLAFDHYSHFTSPIRRYPDIMAHRLLQHYLDGGKSANQEAYEEQCDHCSEMEIFSVSAERDSIKFMQVKFMQDHKDQKFLGVISGVTDFGIFIEIAQNKCEGMVRLRDIEGDHFEYDAKNFAVIGRQSHKKFQLGDEVYIKVKNADLQKRQLDFTLLGSREDIEN